MRQSKKNNFEEIEKEEQRSIEFSEYPQLHEYYSTQMKSKKKPTKIILTEIYSPSQTQKDKYSIQMNSYKSYKNIHSNQDEIYQNYNSNKYCEDPYSRLNIRKIYNNSPETLNIKSLNENILENFKYYETKNIRDNSNKKYESITKVIGYSNIIPNGINQKLIQKNYSYNNIYINKYKTDNNNKYNTKNKIIQDYRIKKKSTNTIQTIQQYQKKEFQKPNNTLINKKIEINKKYEIKKKPEIKINTNIDYSQYKRKKKEEIKTDTKKNFETIKKSNKTEEKIKTKNESKTKKEVKEPKIIQRRENIRKEFAVHSGKYNYKDNISNDIINSRKKYNENTQDENIKKIQVVQKSSKSRNIDKDKDKKTIQKKEVKTTKINTNLTKKININSDMSSYKRKKEEIKKVQNNNNNTTKNYNYNIKVKNEFHTKIDENKYKRGMIKINKMNNYRKIQKNETEERKLNYRNKTPTARKINFGDNYRFYERKYLQIPDDNYFTIRHKRSHKIIFDNEEDEIGNNYTYFASSVIKKEKHNNKIISNINESFNDNNNEN